MESMEPKMDKPNTGCRERLSHFSRHCEAIRCH